LSSGTKQNQMLKIVTLKSGNWNKTLKNSCRLKKNIICKHIISFPGSHSHSMRISYLAYCNMQLMKLGKGSTKQWPTGLRASQRNMLANRFTTIKVSKLKVTSYLFPCLN